MKDKAGFVYVLRAGDYFKIGRTKHFDQRVKHLTRQSPTKSELFLARHVSDAVNAEKYLHIRFKKYRTNGEWFRIPKYKQGSIAGELDTFCFYKQFETEDRVFVA